MGGFADVTAASSYGAYVLSFGDCWMLRKFRSPRIEVSRVTKAEIAALEEQQITTGESPLQQALILQCGRADLLAARLTFARPPEERAALMATFSDDASQGAVFTDLCQRNASAREPSKLMVRDCHPYNFGYRAETNDWFFRRELHLSHAMFDTIMNLMPVEFPVCDKRVFLAHSRITLEDIRPSNIAYERPYSGSVLRGIHRVRSVLLSPQSDEVLFAKPESRDSTIRLIESC